MILRTLIAKFGFDIDEEKLKGLNKKLISTRDRMNSVAKSAATMGSKLTVGLTLPILAVGAAMIKSASDAEETESKFNTVFRDIGGQANKTADVLSKAFGLGSTKARELLGDTADLLTGFNFTQKNALELSNEVQELAVDLASFTNFSGGAEGASKALTKALLGERESVKSLGISILEEDVKKKVALLTSQGVTFETERQAKAFATLKIAQEQSKNAIGDYARTNKQFANQWRLMFVRIRDIAESFGKILLPVALKVLKVFISTVEWTTKLSKGTKTLILIIASLAATIGPLLLLFSGLLTMVGLAISGFTALTTALGVTNLALLLLIAKFVLIGLAIAAAFAVVFLIIDDLIAFFRGEDSLTGVIIEEIGKAVDWVNEKFMTIPDAVRTAMALALTPLRAMLSMIGAVAGALGALSGGDFSGALGALKEGVTKTLDINAAASGGLGGLVGVGPSASTSKNNINNVNSNIEIKVLEGTSPEQVGPFVQEGVKNGLADLFQETEFQLTNPIAE